MTEHRETYRRPDGRLRLPFAHVGDFLLFQGIVPSTAERRAIENAVQFVISLAIFAQRLRHHLEGYRSDSWVDVPLYELFLDTQGLFLFTEQYLEDVALILRLSLPHDQRHQMPAAFRKLTERLREQVLDAEDPLKRFLDCEALWFDELHDVRDDICHRTAYNKARTATFPGLGNLMVAGGGKSKFLSAADLRAYIGTLFRKTLALSCLAEEFVYHRIALAHPGVQSVPPAFIIAEGEIDLTVSTKEPLFPLGTAFMTLSPAALENLDFFLDDRVAEPSNPAL
jgi:hypothetical protein